MLSIVIVNWNTCALLLRCLTSLAHHLAAWPHEVIVVDNASTDGSADMVAELRPHVRLIRNAENRGFAAAVNQGVAIARGEHVWLFNPDALLTHDAYAPLRAALAADPALAAVGPQLLEADGAIQRSANRFFGPARSLLINAWTGPAWRKLAGGRFLDGEAFDHAEARRVDWLKGAALLIRMEAWRAIGPLDERFFLYGEEVDWCYRAAQQGWGVYFEPAARVVHVGEGSSSQVRAWSAKQEQLSRLLFLRKHYAPGVAGFYRLRTRLTLALRATAARRAGRPDAPVLAELAAWYATDLERSLAASKAC